MRPQYCSRCREYATDWETTGGHQCRRFYPSNGWTGEERLKQAELAIQRIKDIVCGDRNPNWTDPDSTMHSRLRIADICDVVLTQ